MIGFAPLKVLVSAMIASLALLGATAAAAQEAEALASRAADAYNSALHAGRNGQFQISCHGFRNAATLYQNAFDALGSYATSTQQERDYVRGQADFIRGNAAETQRAIDRVCPVAAGSAVTPGYFEFDNQLKLLRSTAVDAANQARDAVSKYEAGDFAGSCASSRSSADGYTRVAAALRADPELESSFANPAQIYANAKQASADRDEFYCKAQ